MPKQEASEPPGAARPRGTTRLNLVEHPRYALGMYYIGVYSVRLGVESWLSLRSRRPASRSPSTSASSATASATLADVSAAESRRRDCLSGFGAHRQAQGRTHRFHAPQHLALEGARGAAAHLRRLDREGAPRRLRLYGRHAAADEAKGGRRRQLGRQGSGSVCTAAAAAAAAAGRQASQGHAAPIDPHDARTCATRVGTALAMRGNQLQAKLTPMPPPIPPAARRLHCSTHRRSRRTRGCLRARRSSRWRLSR